MLLLNSGNRSLASLIARSSGSFALEVWGELFGIRFPFFLPNLLEHLVYLGTRQGGSRTQHDGDPAYADHNLHTGEGSRHSVRGNDVAVSQGGHGDDREVDE